MYVMTFVLFVLGCSAATKSEKLKTEPSVFSTVMNPAASNATTENGQPTEVMFQKQTTVLSTTFPTSTANTAKNQSTEKTRANSAAEKRSGYSGPVKASGSERSVVHAAQTSPGLVLGGRVMTPDLLFLACPPPGVKLRIERAVIGNVLDKSLAFEDKIKLRTYVKIYGYGEDLKKLQERNTEQS